MYIPEILSIVGLIISALVFYWYAHRVNRDKLSLDGFMLANKSLNKNQFSHTFAASTFSLGMMVTFLLANTKAFGIYILVSPITLISGHLVFTYVIKNSKIDLNDCRTLSDIIYKIYPSKNIAKLVTALTISSYLMMLFIELYVGTVLLTIFLGEQVFYKTLSFFLMGSVSLLYTRLGGYTALVKTDKYQLLMMGFAVAAIFLFGLLSPVINLKSSANLVANIMDYKSDTFSMIVFMIWLASINFVFPFTQLACYQRLSATKCKNTSWLGIIKGAKKLLVLMVLTISGFMLIHLKGYEMNNLSDFLTLVRDGDLFSKLVLFPILITGGASMVFSSTDIAIIAMSYALSDSNTFRKRFTNMNDKALRKTLTLFTLAVLVILTIIYWLQYAGLQAWLMPLVYTACGQLAILAGIPLYSIFKLKKENEFKSIKVTKTNSFILGNSIAFGWALLFVGGYLAKVTGNEFFSLMAMPVSGICIFSSIIFTERLQISRTVHRDVRV